jgi:hypothetical protein
VAGRVGPGWRSLVLGMHRELLVHDTNYRLVDLQARNGRLRVYARFWVGLARWCEPIVADAVFRSRVICEICGREGLRRNLRPVIHTLCDDCHRADRATAAERGERYANIVVDRLLSGDPAFPEPDAVERWLQALESGV